MQRRCRTSWSVALRVVGGNAVLLCVMPAGCGIVFAPLTDIPAMMDRVLTEPDAFTTEIPADTSGLEIVADIGDFEGCWATYSTGPSTSSAVSPAVFAQTLEIDVAAGALERVIFEQIPPFFRVVDVQRGPFVLEEEGAATFTVEEILSTINTGRLRDVRDDYDTLPVYNVSLRLDDGRLVATFVEPGDPRTPGGFADDAALLHRTIECE